MASYIKGETQAKGIRKQDSEANISVQKKGMRMLHNEELHSST